MPTFVESVTSADASIPSSLVPSVCKSLPSIVPPIATLFDASSTTAFDAGSVQNTSLVPALKLTKLSELELENTSTRESVSGEPSVTVPRPTSK